jgi:parallel beta-helix repeat protein
LDSSEVVFVHNDVEASWTGIGVTQYTFYDPDGWVPRKPSSFLIADNHIRISGNMPNPGEGIFLLDQFRLLPAEQRKTMLDAAIINNTVETAPGALSGISLWGSDRTRVIGNRVTGSGTWAISAHGATECRVFANKVGKFNGQMTQVYLAGAGEATGGDSGGGTPITAAYAATSNCLVLADKTDQVLDEGDNNRVIRH